MISQREDAHVTTGKKLLLEQFRGKPVIDGFLGSFLNLIQDLEDEVWLVLWGWYLGQARAGQLDDLGAIVGEFREGRNDVEYEAAIRTRVRVNRSQGRAIDILEVAALIVAAFLYTEFRVLEWQVDTYNLATSSAIGMARALTQAKAASSYGALVTSNWAEANVFKFDTAGGNTHVWATSTGATPDKRYPSAIPTNPPYRRS